MHYKFSCPKDPLLLKSVSEKTMRGKDKLPQNEDRLIPLLQLWTILWNDGTPNTKENERHQDGNPTGINTVETTFAVFAAKYVLISNECWICISKGKKKSKPPVWANFAVQDTSCIVFLFFLLSQNKGGYKRMYLKMGVNLKKEEKKKEKKKITASNHPEVIAKQEKSAGWR